MIYLDYNATTPIDKEVAKEMNEFINNNFANPSSSYKMGLAAKKAVEKSRELLKNSKT